VLFVLFFSYLIPYPTQWRNTMSKLKKTKRLIQIACFVCLAAFLGYLLTYHSATLLSMNQFLQNYQEAITMIRWSIMLLVIYCYPMIIKALLCSKKSLPKELVEEISRRRWPLIAFIIYEVFLVHNILAVILQFIIG